MRRRRHRLRGRGSTCRETGDLASRPSWPPLQDAGMARRGRGRPGGYATSRRPSTTAWSTAHRLGSFRRGDRWPRRSQSPTLPRLAPRPLDRLPQPPTSRRSVQKATWSSLRVQYLQSEAYHANTCTCKYLPVRLRGGMKSRLDETELKAWQALLHAHNQVTRKLDAALQKVCGLSLGDYDVLLRLARW